MENRNGEATSSDYRQPEIRIIATAAELTQGNTLYELTDGVTFQSHSYS